MKNKIEVNIKIEKISLHSEKNNTILVYNTQASSAKEFFSL